MGLAKKIATVFLVGGLVYSGARASHNLSVAKAASLDNIVQQVETITEKPGQETCWSLGYTSDDGSLDSYMDGSIVNLYNPTNNTITGNLCIKAGSDESTDGNAIVEYGFTLFPGESQNYNTATGKDVSHYGFKGLNEETPTPTNTIPYTATNTNTATSTPEFTATNTATSTLEYTATHTNTPDPKTPTATKTPEDSNTPTPYSTSTPIRVTGTPEKPVSGGIGDEFPWELLGLAGTGAVAGGAYILNRRYHSLPIK